MKLTIGQEEFITGIQAVQNVVSTRTTLPILANVLMKAEGNQLKMTATDLDVTITKTVKATVEEEGSFTMPVKKLHNIAREVGGKQVKIEVNKGICSIESGSFSTRLNGLPEEEFPPMPEFSEQNIIKMEQAKVKSMLRRTAYAVSLDENRYVLNGLFLSFKDKKLTMVATDGRRLALAEEEAEQPQEKPIEIIVPTKAIQELSRQLGEEGEVEIKITENQASFSTGEKEEGAAQVVTKLVEGAYPNYKQVIPSESKYRVTMDKEELLHALKRADIMTSDKANSVKLTFTENNLMLTSNTPEVGESKETMAISYSGEETSIAFNPQYFIDPLKALEEEEVHFEFTDQLSPGVIKVNRPFLYVIMPMRTS
ncbi:MAG: DNA polymerase III subunit beta [Nitrospinaceae bacterium]|nr:DNA polymerase III subunit beta [Nitrospinaceae bacterium]